MSQQAANESMPTQDTQHKLQVAYIMDPLCGWCYAASPIVDAMRRAS